MVNLGNFCKNKNDIHYLNDVYAFVTVDTRNIRHFYVTGSHGTIIELTDSDHEEFSDCITVEEFADTGDEIILKIYEEFNSFCVKLEDSN